MADLIRNRQWSDMDPLLRLDATGRVRRLTGKSALEQSIRNIMLTMKFSRVRTPFGSDIYRVLHKPVTTETAEEIHRIVNNAIRQYDNRISGLNIRIIPYPEEQYFELRIRFQENGSLSYEEIVTFLDGRIIE